MMDGEEVSFGVRRGMDVLDARGETVGRVKDALGDRLLSHKGWLFPDDHEIPASAIQSVDERGVHLSLTKDDLVAAEHDPASEPWTPVDEGVYDPTIAPSSAEVTAATSEFDAQLTEDDTSSRAAPEADVLEDVAPPPVIPLQDDERARHSTVTVHLID
jgi:hypothetical protein